MSLDWKTRKKEVVKVASKEETASRVKSDGRWVEGTRGRIQSGARGA